jgi:hypothetical protein
MLSRRLIAAVLVSAMTFAGCTSLKTVRPVVPGEPPRRAVRSGDAVVVLTRDGASARFVVRQVDGETLIATDGRRFDGSELVRVERKEFSGPKTFGLIAGIAGGAFWIVAISVGHWLAENSQ